MLTIALYAKTSGSLTLQLAARTALYDRVDVQYSARPDFQFVLSPVVFSMTPDGNNRVVLAKLNQANTYFVRARERRTSNGALLPWTNPISVYLPQAVAPVTTPQAVMVRPAMIVVPEPVFWQASNTREGYPTVNLNTDAPGEQAVAMLISAGGGGYINFHTSGAPVDTLALLGTNAPEGMHLQLASWPTLADRDVNAPTFRALFTSLHASPNLTGRPQYHCLVRMDAPTTDIAWRIYFYGEAGYAGDGYPPGGDLWAMFGVVGLARTAKNIAADKVETPLDYGGIERLRDGTPDRRYGYRGRRVEFDIALMTEAQWETQFSDLRQKVGLTDPVLVIPNTRTGAFLHDRILYGPIAQLRAQQPFTPRFTQSFAIESLI